MSTFAWWADAGMTIPLARLDFVRSATPGAVDAGAWFGSPVAGKQLQATPTPGTTPVQVSLVDAAAGSGVELADVRLALSQSGLAAATPGAALTLGTTLASGSAIQVWARISSAIAAVGNYDDMRMRVAGTVETDA